MVEYRYLNAFLKTAETQSFTEAGKALQVAQSAISRQIKLLEESLGRQLFIRSPQSVILTPFGQELLKQLKFFDHWSSEQTSDNKKLNLKIGAFDGVLQYWLIGFLSEFANTHSPNKIEIERISTEDVADQLMNGKLDAAFYHSPIDSELLTSRRLFLESLCLVSSKRISLKDVEHLPWIYSESGWNLRKLSKRHTAAEIKVNSIDAILQLVENNVGIAVVPEHGISPDRKLHKLKLDLKSNYVYLVTANYQIWPQHLKLLIQAVDQYLKVR